jgi:hypothetical protein
MEKQKISEGNRILFFIIVVTVLIIISFVYLFKELALSSSELKIFGVSLFAMIVLIGMNIYFMYVIYKIFQNNSISIENIKSRIQTRCPFEAISLSKGNPGEDTFCEGCFLFGRNQCRVREGLKKLNS